MGRGVRSAEGGEGVGCLIENPRRGGSPRRGGGRARGREGVCGELGGGGG